MMQEFRCTKHDLRFASARPKDMDLALVRCPQCSHEEILRLRVLAGELQAHRDLLLKAIDLKQLLTTMPA